MTYCSFDSLLHWLDTKGVEFVEPIPSCPKHLNYVCMQMAGKCSIGNKRQCVQLLQFIHENRFFSVQVIFSFTENSKTGFIRSEDTGIKRMLSRHMITESELAEMS